MEWGWQWLLALLKGCILGQIFVSQEQYTALKQNRIAACE
jgi:hypothetical protein